MSTNRLVDSMAPRTSETTLEVTNPYGVPVTLFANREVPIEVEALEQALGFVSVQRTIEELDAAQRAGQIRPFWGDRPGKLERVVLTPDFHRGSGIPVGTVALARGFVVPQAVGNDVCCGMRLLATDVTRAELDTHLDAIQPALREVFFQGKRQISMSPRQREALLRDGLWGLLETSADNAGDGLWRYYDPRAQEADLSRVHFQGVVPAKEAFGNPAMHPIKKMKRSEFPADAKLETGTRFAAKGADNGLDVVLQIEKIDGDTVETRWVHPLADKDLTYNLEVMAVTDPRPPPVPVAALKLEESEES